MAFTIHRRVQWLVSIVSLSVIVILCEGCASLDPVGYMKKQRNEIEALSLKTDSSTVIALIKKYEKGEFRAEAISAIGKIGTPFAFKMLDSLLLINNHRFQNKYHLPIGYTGNDTLKDMSLSTDCGYYDKQNKTYWKLAKTWGGGVWDLWICHSPDGDKWSPFYYVPSAFKGFYFSNFVSLLGQIPGMNRKKFSLKVQDGRLFITHAKKIAFFTAQKDTASFAICDILRDSDNDGITDALEINYGANLLNPDSDGDGVPDGKDRNPLTSKSESNDSTAVQQAVFDWLLLSTDTPGNQKGMPLYLVDLHMWIEHKDMSFTAYHQELQHSSGYIIPRKEWRSGSLNIVEFHIESMDQKEAVVFIGTMFEPLWGSGWKCHLNNKNGRWVVYESSGTWAS